jgi:hypothetical protein
MLPQPGFTRHQLGPTGADAPRHVAAEVRESAAGVRKGVGWAPEIHRLQGGQECQLCRDGGGAVWAEVVGTAQRASIFSFTRAVAFV